MIESLARRLLRLSSGGVPPLLSGRDLREHLGPELDHALGRRVLVELPSLDEWPTCAGCDQECEARPIHELDGRPVAMCPHNAAFDELLSEEDVRQFELDPEELCLAIREDSRLSGDGPVEIVDNLWLIGETCQEAASPRYIFMAFRIPSGPVASIPAVLRRTADPRPVTLLLTGQPDLKVRLALQDAEVPAKPVVSVLADEPEAPFRLDLDRVISTSPRSRLVIRCSDRSVTFDGRSARLSQQLFQLLLWMAREAQQGRPLIENGRIEHELWGHARRDRQLADVIRRLRDALTPVLGGREQADRLIQNRPGNYLVDTDFADIEIL